MFTKLSNDFINVTLVRDDDRYKAHKVFIFKPLKRKSQSPMKKETPFDELVECADASFWGGDAIMCTSRIT